MMYIQIIYMMTSCIFVSLHYNHHHQAATSDLSQITCSTKEDKSRFYDVEVHSLEFLFEFLHCGHFEIVVEID